MANIHLLLLTYSNTVAEDNLSAKLASLASQNFKTISVTTASEQYFLGDTLDFSGLLPTHLSLSSRPSWMRMGLITWKYRLILQHLLSQIPPGDLLLYHDYDFHKYPQYLSNISDASADLLSSAYNDVDLATFDEGFKPLSTDVPTGLIRFYEALLPKHSSVCSGIWAGALLVRHTPLSIQFLQSLTASCSYSYLLSILRHITSLSTGERFSGEQSILSLLKLSAPNLFHAIKIASIHTRNRQIPVTRLARLSVSIRFRLSQLKHIVRLSTDKRFLP